MKTKIYKHSDIQSVLELLEAGEVVAFPTDTVFGVGVTYGNDEALQKLKQAKQRDANKPIPVMVSSMKQIEELAYVTPQIRKVLQTYMPGAFTAILKAKQIQDGNTTIAIRMPDDAFLQELLRKPLYVTSANLSGELPGKNEREVLKQLDNRIAGIVEGEAKSNIASTIIDFSKVTMECLRAGEIPFEEIKKVWEEYDENSSCM